ncbi:MAG: hypothetical protein JWM97_694, partial [Phycisphaerales bacterium]|nr:hypothetical protein [Phycisphaerales bacterium]
MLRRARVRRGVGTVRGRARLFVMLGTPRGSVLARRRTFTRVRAFVRRRVLAPLRGPGGLGGAVGVVRPDADALAGQPLDGAQERTLLGVAEGNRLAGRAGPAGAADAVNVRLRH